ncbi:AtpZ/AtpI family protein [Magnetospira sp. QH-2]|uniref:AtpZ/AtpI family protein n=1 Tax=Magnetospira sp. (strain QH-2) TaxID=1288970 RepID=UPI0003E80B01|nr:AtpZ/AtpI family protein [Magnetospira sp. QH-2]CCQ72665.1 putative ATP synthase subunit I [Magnetospira sp. QH-2]
MVQDPEDQPLKDLDARLNKAMADRGLTPETDETQSSLPPRPSDMGMGMRIGAEILVGPLVGAWIGWYLDGWLETRPLLMIILLFAGGAAGLMNVYRVVNGHGMAVGYKKKEDDSRADVQSSSRDNENTDRE